MDRVYQFNVSLTPPATPTSFAIGFAQGDAAQPGYQLTVPGPWWFYMVTESIRNVIVTAGLVPDPTSTTQLFTAIKILAALQFPAISLSGGGATQASGTGALVP